MTHSNLTKEHPSQTLIDLPADVLLNHILVPYSTLEDYFTLRATNRFFYNFFNQPEHANLFWQALYQRYFGNASYLAVVKSSDTLADAFKKRYIGKLNKAIAQIRPEIKEGKKDCETQEATESEAQSTAISQTLSEERLRLSQILGNDGCSIAMWLEEQTTIQVKPFAQYFIFAAKYSRLNNLMAIYEKAAASLQAEMLEADIYGAFFYAAGKGHLAVIEKLWEWANASKLQAEMLEADDYGAFFNAAGKGHVAAAEKLWEWGTSSQQEAILTEVARNTSRLDRLNKIAKGGHIAVLEKLWKWAALKGQEASIIKRSYCSLAEAACAGHLIIIEKLWEYASQKQQKAEFVSNSFRALDEAAKNGHLTVVEKLWQILSSEPAMINEEELLTSALKLAVSNGHVAVMEKLWELCSKRIQRGMLEDDIYYASRIAAQNGHIAALEKFRELASSYQRNKMLEVKENLIFWCARERLTVLEKLWGWATLSQRVSVWQADRGEIKRYQEEIFAWTLTENKQLRTQLSLLNETKVGLLKTVKAESIESASLKLSVPDFYHVTTPLLDMVRLQQARQALQFEPERSFCDELKPLKDGLLYQLLAENASIKNINESLEDDILQLKEHLANRQVNPATEVADVVSRKRKREENEQASDADLGDASQISASDTQLTAEETSLPSPNLSLSAVTFFKQPATDLTTKRARLEGVTDMDIDENEQISPTANARNINY